jgi:hypothetical protein
MAKAPARRPPARRVGVVKKILKRRPPPPPPRRGGGRVVRAANPIPRGLSASHHFNAFGPQRPQALAFSVGPATHISGAARFRVQLATDKAYTLLAFQPGGGVNQVVYSTETTADPGIWAQGSHEHIASTGILYSPSSASPDTVMCSRGSIRIRNLTAAGQVAGAVHVLRAATGLADFYSAPTESEAVKDLILQNARTVTMSGSQLTETHQWDCIPVSQDKYHAFTAPSNGTAVMADPGVTTVLLLLEHMASGVQTYEFSMAASYYARYRFIGPLANCANPPPTISLDVVNRLRNAAEAIGSAGRPVMSAAMGALRDSAAEAMPGILGNMVRQNVGFPQLTRSMLAIAA